MHCVLIHFGMIIISTSKNVSGELKHLECDLYCKRQQTRKCHMHTLMQSYDCNTTLTCTNIRTNMRTHFNADTYCQTSGSISVNATSTQMDLPCGHTAKDGFIHVRVCSYMFVLRCTCITACAYARLRCKIVYMCISIAAYGSMLPIFLQVHTCINLYICTTMKWTRHDTVKYQTNNTSKTTQAYITHHIHT